MGLINLLRRSVDIRSLRRRKKKRLAYRGLRFESLESRDLLTVINYSEPPDLTGLAGDDVFAVDVGTNVWNGTVASPGDTSDQFTVDLPETMKVTSVRFQYTDLQSAPNQFPDSGGISSSAGFSHLAGAQTTGGANVDVTNGAFDNPPTLPITVDFTVNVFGNFAFPAAPWTLTLTVDLLNTQPIATNTTQTITYQGNEPSVPLTSAIVVTDPDAGESITASLTLADTATGSIPSNDGAIYTPGTGVWTITGSVSAVNTALANVVFQPVANNTADTTIAVHIADGGEDGAVPVTGSLILDVAPFEEQPCEAIQLVADVAGGPADGDPGNFVVFEDKLFFEAAAGGVADEPFVYDPVTDVVTQINTDSHPVGDDSNITEMFVFNGNLYANMETNGLGRELFKYNTTTGIFELFVDLNPGPGDGRPNVGERGVLLNGDLYFSATDDTNGGDELYKFRASDNTIVRVADVVPGPADGDPGNFVVFEDKLFFEAETAAGDDEPFVYDPAADTFTQINTDSHPVGDDSNITEMFVFNGNLYANMETNGLGRELFKYNTTTGIFELFVDLNPGLGDGRPNVGERGVLLGVDLYFSATDDTNGGDELYRFTICPTNTQPTATNTTQTIGYLEDAASVPLTPGIVVTDPDVGESVTASLTLADTATGSMSSNDGATYTPGTGVWTITGSVTVVNTALANVVFQPAANNAVDTTIAVNIADGGEDGAVPVTGTLTLDATPVNDEPSITIGSNQAVNEDAGAQTVAGFASGFDPGGGADEASQSIDDFIVSNDNNGLFSVQPDIDNSGQLTYTLAPDANGTATVTVQVRDDGGTANGGDDTSIAQTFDIIVASVNDEPSFTTLGDQTVNEDSGPHTVVGFAAASPGGGADESGQTFTYNVSNDIGSLFSVAPAIDVNGQLTYTLAPDANGTAIVTVSVTDNGGTANGGDDTSPDQTFAINILSEEEQLASQQQAIADLVDSGALNAGQGNALSSKLTNVLSKLDKGKAKAAKNQVQAYINQLNALVSGDVLTPAEAEPLIDAAEAILISIM